MGFRFRKSFRIAPGVRINLSKSGVSTSLGKPGATINIGKSGVRGTVGVPGSGLSYSEMLVRRSKGQSATGEEHPVYAAQSGRRLLFFLAAGFAALIVILLIGSWNADRAQSVPAEAAITPDIVPAEAPGSLTTMAKVNCRATPDKRGGLIASIEADTPVSTISVQGRWTKIRSAGSTCWVSSDYLG